MTDTRTRWLLKILLLALVARVVAAFVIGDDFKFADEARYVDTARRLSSGGGFGIEYLSVPGYPIFLAVLSAGVPVGLMFIRAAQAIIAGLGAGLVIVLGERMLSRRAAMLAGLVYALDPLLVIASGLLYPETIAALVLALAILLALDAAERDRPQSSALTGLLLGLLALLRPVALVLPPVVATWIVLTLRARASRRLVHASVLGFASLLALAPWTARNLSVYGRLMPISQAGLQTAPVGAVDVAQRGLVRSLAQWAWDNPSAFVLRSGRQFLGFWELSPSGMSSDDPVRRAELHLRDPRLPVQPVFSRRLRDLVSAGFSGLELSLGLMGVVLVVRTRQRRILLPLAVILAYAMGYALFVGTLRYRIAVLPLVFLFSGAGADWVLSLIQAGERRPSGISIKPADARTHRRSPPQGTLRTLGDATLVGDTGARGILPSGLIVDVVGGT